MNVAHVLLAVTVKPCREAPFASGDDILAETIAHRLKEVEAAMAALLTTSKIQWGMDEDEDEGLVSRIIHTAIDNIHVCGSMASETLVFGDVVVRRFQLSGCTFATKMKLPMPASR